MRRIKLMADYDSHPLWEASPGRVGNIDPATLPISDALRSELLVWTDRYNATFDRNDPLVSGFASTDEEADFWREGVALATRLQYELGPEYAVIMRQS